MEKTTLINVENIPCYCSIGIHDEEKAMGQRLYISVYLDIDSTNAVDDVNSTISYVDVYKIVQDTAKAKSHNLIETLSEKIACNVLNLPLAKSVKVKVRKPHIPFEEFQGDVSIEVERRK